MKFSSDGRPRREPLYVVFTMDCERIAAESPEGGPEDWDLSERAIAGFCETLLGEGIRPTLFLMPETAQRHKRLLRGLAAQGVDLGMHMHPQCFGDHRHTRYLGEYDRDEQSAILAEGLDTVGDALGARPRSFRSGNFSASDDTFPVLHELGFRQGCVSNPGRNIARFHAYWTGACQDVHRADAVDRLVAGQLDFLEVPLTTDPDRVDSNGWAPELRIESGGFRAHHLPIIERALERMDTERVAFRALCVFTHNCFDYSDGGVEQSGTLRDLVRHFGTLAEHHDVRFVNLAALRAAFDEG